MSEKSGQRLQWGDEQAGERHRLGAPRPRWWGGCGHPESGPWKIRIRRRKPLVMLAPGMPLPADVVCECEPDHDLLPLKPADQVQVPLVA